ncbi:hypothetical protein TNCT_456971 [Trichonephila clavata]|uniref:Uncharacterized protein n=1 Tax=Trichonephila clavata TaxID=2740835 RepID=A0A8X6HZ07_TRICU|nr:hypothetical protein TNCT_456971 [Trichonephila clavata]
MNPNCGFRTPAIETSIKPNDLTKVGKSSGLRIITGFKQLAQSIKIRKLSPLLIQQLITLVCMHIKPSPSLPLSYAVLFFNKHLSLGGKIIFQFSKLVKYPEWVEVGEIQKGQNPTSRINAT